MGQLLGLEAFYNFILAMILETTRTAHLDHAALHFRYQHTPVEKRPLKISVTRKQLPSRKTCNGLPRKDPLAYDKAMKLLASILMITLLATVAQPTAAEKATNPLEFGGPHFTAVLQIIGKMQSAMEIMGKYCDQEGAIKILKKEVSRKTPPKMPLNTDPRIVHYITTCKSLLKQNGANTNGTDAIFIIMDKLMSFTEEEWFKVKSLAPEDTVLKKLNIEPLNKLK